MPPKKYEIETKLCLIILYILNVLENLYTVLRQAREWAMSKGD